MLLVVLIKTTLCSETIGKLFFPTDTEAALPPNSFVGTSYLALYSIIDFPCLGVIPTSYYCISKGFFVSARMLEGFKIMVSSLDPSLIF